MTAVKGKLHSTLAPISLLWACRHLQTTDDMVGKRLAPLGATLDPMEGEGGKCMCVSHTCHTPSLLWR